MATCVCYGFWPVSAAHGGDSFGRMHQAAREFLTPGRVSSRQGSDASRGGEVMWVSRGLRHITVRRIEPEQGLKEHRVFEIHIPGPTNSESKELKQVQHTMLINPRGFTDLVHDEGSPEQIVRHTFDSHTGLLLRTLTATFQRPAPSFHEERAKMLFWENPSMFGRADWEDSDGPLLGLDFASYPEGLLRVLFRDPPPTNLRDVAPKFVTERVMRLAERHNEDLMRLFVQMHTVAEKQVRPVKVWEPGSTSHSGRSDRVEKLDTDRVDKLDSWNLLEVLFGPGAGSQGTPGVFKRLGEFETVSDDY